MTNRAAPPSRPPTRRSAAVTAEQQSTSARRNRTTRRAEPAKTPRSAGEQQFPRIRGTEPETGIATTSAMKKRASPTDPRGTRTTPTHPATGPQRGKPTLRKRRATRPPRAATGADIQQDIRSTPQTMEIAEYDQLVILIVFSRSATIGQRLRARVGDPASEGLPVEINDGIIARRDDSGHVDLSDESIPAICGHLKSGHFRRPETGVEYSLHGVLLLGKVVRTLVRQLRGPHLSTCA